MRVAFEDIAKRENFIACTDRAGSGVRRFTTPPLIDRLINHFNNNTVEIISGSADHYIIGTGVNHHPLDWAKDSIFEKLPKQNLVDLQQSRAMLCIDQSLEGYHTPWLWDWFHKECTQHNVNPKAIIYVTGNAQAPLNYNLYVKTTGVTPIKVIVFEHFEPDLMWYARSNPKPVINPNTKVKLYDCLNKRPRTHRSWFFLKLLEAKLIGEGIISMNDYGPHIPTLNGEWPSQQLLEYGRKFLPMLIDGKANNVEPDPVYIGRVLPELYVKTWVSIVTEPQFADYEQSTFCSEKIFKPIACLQPFIVVGGQGSLARLRELGYKTFDGFIDESYDTLPTEQRLDAIIVALQKLKAIEDKASWLENIKPILEHNYNNLITLKKHQAIVDLESYYKEYFNV